jgi:hypothetical protein
MIVLMPIHTIHHWRWGAVRVRAEVGALLGAERAVGVALGLPFGVEAALFDVLFRVVLLIE